MMTINVEQARRLLSDDENYNDEELRDLLDLLYSLADIAIDAMEQRCNGERSKGTTDDC